MANGRRQQGSQESQKNELANSLAGVAKDAEQYISRISGHIAEEAERTAQQALSEYEKKIEQIVADSRTELKEKSLEMSEQIREAILLKAEETASRLVDRIMTDKGNRAQDMAKELREGKLEKKALAPADAAVKEKEAEAPAAATDEAAGEKPPAQETGMDAEKHVDAEYKSAKVAAEFGYKIENLGLQDRPEGEKQTGQNPDDGTHTTELIKNDGDEADIDDFVRYLSA